ncbi:MCE family protein [Rhodococcus sp. 27YEA15]|uniref:MCE family protein n=1 Tax=Rhodococcus sp. 27YEA15 TaxID=3156259 RepID=UPI003C7B059A
MPYKSAGAAMVTVLVATIVVCLIQFRDGFSDKVQVTVVSDRSGLVLDTGAKVQVRGVLVGRVAGVDEKDGKAVLRLDLDPARVDDIPDDVSAQIKSTTAFGAKYVQLDVPRKPVSQPIAAGAVITSTNVTTEVNTLFENLNSVMTSVDQVKLNAILSAFSDGLRGRGAALGDTMVGAGQLLDALQPVLPTMQRDFRLAGEVAMTYADAAPDILDALERFEDTARTLTDMPDQFADVLDAAIAMGDSGHALIAPSVETWVDANRLLVPTTALLHEYSPEYTCMIRDMVTAADTMGRTAGGNGRSGIIDAALLAGDNPYTYPQNLPKVAASGGPGGAPGCYAPITLDNYPAPYLVMDTGASIADSTTVRAADPGFVDYVVQAATGGAR